MRATFVVDLLLIAVIIALVAGGILPEFLRKKTRSEAMTSLCDARLLDAAVDEYAREHNAAGQDKVGWNAVSIYLKPNSRLVQSGGADAWGNQLKVGPTVQDGVTFSQETVSRYDSSIVPETFWGDYHPGKEKNASARTTPPSVSTEAKVPPPAD